MPHCEGSKDQCIKYQFFRPLHIFSVFQCCKHLDILATFVPVWASISCVCIILWVGEIAQNNGFNSARILFYPIPQKSPFWDTGKLLHMWEKKSGFHKWFHLDGYFRQRRCGRPCDQHAFGCPGSVHVTGGRIWPSTRGKIPVHYSLCRKWIYVMPSWAREAITTSLLMTESTCIRCNLITEMG